MKFGKKIGKQVEKGISKGKEYAWRISFLVVICFGLFIIGRPLISLIITSIEIRELNKEKALYQESIRRDSLLIENLKNDEFLERYAREKFLMKRKGEDIFIVE